MRIGPKKEIYTAAKGFQDKAGLSSKDAIHLACSNSVGCTFFLTCDEELIKRAKRLNLSVGIMNPVDYIREANKNESTAI